MRFKDRDYAEFYEVQQREGGYPGELLPPVIEALEGYHSVIDIGAGTGFFTIPLLEAGHAVTAVEPAPEMSALILRKCKPEMRMRLTVINEEWENWRGRKHDAAICIHALYPMSDSGKAIELMCLNSERRVLIVRESNEMITLSGLTRERLGISHNRDFNAEIKSALKRLGANYTVKKIVEERLHRIKSIEDEADLLTCQLRLDGTGKERIKIIIKELCSVDSAGYFFRPVFSDNIYIF